MKLVRTRRPAVAGLVAVGLVCVLWGCGESPPAPVDAAKYQEAKKQHDEVRAKEYGRKSITDKKAGGTAPAGKRGGPR